MVVTKVSPASRPTHVRWIVFSLAFATSALLYLHRYVFAFIKPTLAEEWGLSNTELGQPCWPKRRVLLPTTSSECKDNAVKTLDIRVASRISKAANKVVVPWRT